MPNQVASPNSPSTVSNSEIIQGLEILLADSYAIMAQTHLAHWNVEGPDFFQLHVAFQAQYEELFTAIDDIAEHIRTLEVYAPGGLDMLSGLSKVQAMQRHEAPKDFVAGLVVAHETLVENATKGADLSGDAGDKATEDLYIERLRIHNKTLWLLKSFLK